MAIADFDSIRLRLASPDVIRAWSYGEVSKPETINYRTQKPEKDGLFDERIFGPTKDWECYCGKYKKIRYKGIICDKCGVEVTHSLVRRERMGHVELSAPVSHIWFLRSVPSKIGLALDISIQNLEKVIYFAEYIVTRVDEPLRKGALESLHAEERAKRKAIEAEYVRAVAALGENASASDTQRQLEIKERKLRELDEDFTTTERELRELAPKKIIPEYLYHEWSLKYGHIFDASIGAEAIRALLAGINLEKTMKELEADFVNASGPRVEKLTRRLKLFRSFAKNSLRPEWMVLVNIPIIPPDLRPMVPLDGGRFATSDVNDLYRRVINRNNRLKRLTELNAPAVIVRNEKRMLQEAVDALIDNSARQTKTAVTAAGRKRQLKSLADTLKGKQGRFRQNLLGKRIDYSGRSVIVVGPSLKLHQCGLPKRMALELFKPHVISKLIAAGLVHNIRSANRFIESDRPEVWDALEEVTRGAHVLLNRAPTLHRLGIQAFQPILIEGKAIQIHPMVCRAFNADFDGDQMAVHVPLTEEAKKEAETMMLASQNLLKPATGSPVATPDKDIAWGCYYMTVLQEPKSKNGTVPAFPDPASAIYAYETQKLSLREKMRVRLKAGAPVIETTVGRVLLHRIFPEGFPFMNEIFDVKRLGEVVRLCLEEYGFPRTAKLLDDIKNTGFEAITRSGYSWGIDDLPELPQKAEMVADGDRRINEIEEQYADGLLTAAERHTKIIEVWMEVKDRVTKLSRESLNPASSVFSMIESGARGSWGQLTQMVGMKGLVSNPAGDIIELPVKKSFKEGFDVLEYFISTHGTRKGLADTALRTANAGYLTRRLVDVAQDVVIRSEDCGDEEGVLFTAAEEQELGESLVARVTGRMTMAPIIDAKTKKSLVAASEYVTSVVARKLTAHTIAEARMRSVLSCRLRKGVCVRCYGYDLATNKPVQLGVAVGIIAAQSIGEPGTQLTMRTFHTGGVAGVDITQGLPRVEELFEARAPKRRAVTTDVAGRVTIEDVERKIVDEDGGKRVIAAAASQRVVRIHYSGAEEKRYLLSRGDTAAVADGASVAASQALVTRKDGTQVAAEHDGTVRLGKKDIILVFESPQVKEYVIPPGYVLWVKNDAEVTAGDQLTEGDVDLHELYALKGKEAVQKYVLRCVQAIYALAGQKLNDKHIEIMLKQMFSRVLVADAGDTNLLPGEIVERAEFEEENERARTDKRNEGTGKELFMGISRISLSTQSFLSAASFQETARVLINAAVTGKIDRLEGLKENVIIGRLIPAGTGYRG